MNRSIKYPLKKNIVALNFRSARAVLSSSNRPSVLIQEKRFNWEIGRYSAMSAPDTMMPLVSAGGLEVRLCA